MSERRGRKRDNGRVLLVVLVSAFVLVDAALVVGALSRTSGDDSPQLDAASGGAAASATADPTAGATTPADGAEPTPTPTPTPTSVTVEPSGRLLAAVDADVAYRVASSACGATEAVLEKTLDGGATWASTPVVADEGLSSVLSLRAPEGAQADMVGLAPSTCTLNFTATYTSGFAFRDYPDRLTASWYRSPASPTSVFSPSAGELVTVPCTAVVEVEPVDQTGALALCGDGQVLTTDDGGATWVPGASAPGATSVTEAEGLLRVATTSDASCDGVSVLGAATTTAASLETVGCASVPEDALAQGAPVLSASEDALWLWVGDTVTTSSDGGATWS